MRTNSSGMIVLLIVGVSAGCSVDKADRCGDPYVYEGDFCVEPDDTDADTGTETDTETGSDGPDTDTDTANDVSGLGDVCAEPADCAGFDADYCAIPLGADEGNCAVSNCVADPDDCPADLLCCDFPADGLAAGTPNLCMPQENYDYYDGLVGCHG